MNDKQLIRSCLQGDVEEYRKIVNKYNGRIMAIAINILGNREDAEDACQEAFGIIYNQCLDKLRKRRRFYKFLNKMKRESFQFTNGRASTNSIHHPFPKRVLKNLSLKERAILFLWAVEGYTSEEIGSVLKCSASTARVHLFKARKKIKAILEKENV